MIAGLSGSLLSHDALAGAVRSATPSNAADAHRRVRAWHAAVVREMGPASSARAVFDRIAVRLCAALGFRVTPVAGDGGRSLHAALESGGTVVASLLATEWGRDPAAAWRESVRHGIAAGVRWCFCITGPTLRVFDARRTYSRRFAQFDLEIVVGEPASFVVLYWLLSADGFASPEPPLDRAVMLSERYRSEVRASLQHGVQEALTSLLRAFASAPRTRGAPRDPPALLDESLTVVYRILFLLFAEARGLVPKWHPTYRDSYTIESLRESVERLPKPRGLWHSLQAIARLAHRGCRAGTLRVPPFNGRLFSPSHAPLAESLELDDAAVREAVMALTTRTAAGERQRIAYGDLGVEQLGGVYERILDFEPVSAGGGRAPVLVPAGRRKATGTFYTPRALTEFMVRRALAPLVNDAAPDDILSLRVLDPAMGSGAFLVAACRYLAAAYESALIREGILLASDIGDEERAAFRRAVAQRCLFGVDINPMAVQLGRLSLWLATLAGDRPLTFLDHHLRAGNSIVGASLADILRQRPATQAARRRAGGLPLFELDRADEAVGITVEQRLSLARDPGDTIEQVRAKERLLSSLQHEKAPLASWKGVADLWCAEWFRHNEQARRPATFSALVDHLLDRGSVLPKHVAAPLLDEAAAIARRELFFHWPLEFPEVFHDPDGRPSTAAGFDAVIGNPPWEMLRGERGEAGDSTALTSFTRTSGIYAWQGHGHANLYQLFFERAISLARTGGRIAMVLPSGFAIDHGCAPLRRALLARADVDTFVSVENRDGLFPIHRGLKFLLLTATRGRPTNALPCRFGVRSPDALDGLADGGDPGTVRVPCQLLEAFTGDQLAIPDVRTATDVAILSRSAFAIPALSTMEGWGLTFGRELNATDDRKHFVMDSDDVHYLPIVEGKQIQPFVVDITASRSRIPAPAAARLLGTAGSFTRPRLAYRDVASATNRLTLISAIIPANVVTTHTLFCLKGNVSLEIQQFLCGIFNSFVANYLVRTRVGTHVTVAVIERLPVPKPSVQSSVFGRVAALSTALAADPSDSASAAQLQACVARLYGLTASEFSHILDTFPLVPVTDRSAAMQQFTLAVIAGVEDRAHQA
jgi:hypothetical protein